MTNAVQAASEFALTLHQIQIYLWDCLQFSLLAQWTEIKSNSIYCPAFPLWQQRFFCPHSIFPSSSLNPFNGLFQTPSGVFMVTPAPISCQLWLMFYNLILLEIQALTVVCTQSSLKPVCSFKCWGYHLVSLLWWSRGIWTLCSRKMWYRQHCWIERLRSKRNWELFWTEMHLDDGFPNAVQSLLLWCLTFLTRKQVALQCSCRHNTLEAPSWL